MVGDPPIRGCPSSRFAGSEGRNPRTQRPEVLEDAYGVPQDEGDRPKKLRRKMSLQLLFEHLQSGGETLTTLHELILLMGKFLSKSGQF